MRKVCLSSVRISGKFFDRAESHIEILSQSEKSPEIRPGTKIHVTQVSMMKGLILCLNIQNCQRQFKD